MPSRPTRQQAWELLNEYTKTPNLIKHAISVEAAMRAYARKFGEDEEAWGIVGLLHDFDYDQYPDLKDHPFVGCGILKERGYPEEIIRGVMAHANHTGTPRNSLMEKTIFAVDELCGFITAVTLVRPDRKVANVPVKSVKKKLKDKAFARSVNREDIHQGVEELGVDLNEHIAFVTAALAEVADELGL